MRYLIVTQNRAAILWCIRWHYNKSGFSSQMKKSLRDYVFTSREAAADACGLPLFNSRLQHVFSIPLSHLLNKRWFNSLLEEKKATQHWYICFLHTTMRLFLVLFCTNEMIHFYSEKILQNWHLYVSKHTTFLLDCWEKDIYVFWSWMAQRRSLWKRVYKTAQQTTQLFSSAPEAA